MGFCPGKDAENRGKIGNVIKNFQDPHGMAAEAAPTAGKTREHRNLYSYANQGGMGERICFPPWGDRLPQAAARGEERSDVTEDARDE